MARAFIRDSLGLAASQYLSRMAMLARGLAAAAALGPLGFGAWNALQLILDYGAYAAFGAFQGLDLELPGLSARREAQAAERSMRGAWWVGLTGGAIFTAVVIAILVSGTWVGTTGWGWGAPALMLVAVFLQLAIQYHASAMRAQNAFGAVSGGLAAQSLVGGALGLTLVWSFGVWGLIGGWLLGSLVALAWMRRSPYRPPLAPAAPERGAAMARVGLPIFAFFALMIVLRSVDRIALVRFGGNDALGLYSLGLIASGLVLYLPEAMAAVLFPRVAAAAAARDLEGARARVVRAQRALTVLLPGAIGAGALWAGPVVHRVLPEYAPGVPGLIVLVLASLVLATATLPGYFLLATGQGHRLVAIAAVALVLAGTLVFTVASRDPRPLPVAGAAGLGYALVSVPVLSLAANRLAAGARERAGLVAASLIPTLLSIGLVLALGRGEDSSFGAALRRTGVFLVAYAPALLVFGRGLGLRTSLAPGRGAA